MAVLNDLIIGLYLVFGGCCFNVITLESILKVQKKCGRLITLIQFIFIASEGLIRNIQFHNPLKEKRFPISLKPRKAPLYKWILMVVLFFVSSVLNNLVFEYHISIPVHIIFRSGSIIMNMLLSFLILKRRYSVQQILAICTVTVGLIITTLSSAKDQGKTQTQETNLYEWIIGIIILIISSFTGALMGIYQEYMFKKYPNTWKECIFYNHLLSVPIFLVFLPQIKEQWHLFQTSPKNRIGYYLPIPLLPSFISNIKIQGVWLLVIANIITQYICVSGVQKLSSLCSSVTLNLILNIRKFISLLISVIFFDNPFSSWSWFGSIFVFIGVVWYVKASDMKKKKEKEAEKKNK
ncbi:UDP-xylose and UDP-N-acetylglucosamine transporter-like protein [Neocallimastix californiae]|uniref:UDP-xylose and UDP-N-acetylglucosamine transporter-like protein n=1 Tax=Neocallimastix californiae TaxID=1754190 RepID=A0A1Y2ENJ1_9FUNG|nr:UDP-xylose and UDP-N-acetylglucosamine transporter-like protein [Neocallimastix californiae]|eukprot:ORY72874.1 UDP-xylose and UDP-N-acetylglucosamine transporter-like protein [Neocallimastix californiae]